MARGLSPLQQQILRLAWEREQPAPGRRNTQRILFSQEILVRLYHWPITHQPAWQAREREHGLALCSAQHFQPSVIGVQRYRAGIVAVSRSLGRLQARGLLQRSGDGGWRIDTMLVH